MVQRLTLGVLLVGLAVVAANASDSCAEARCLAGVVVGVTDGDTVTLLVDSSAGKSQKKVRLLEIDTPERGQPWSARARQALAGKVFQKQVQIRHRGEDRYGRLLGRIYRDGRDVNREMVREGHAWAYRAHLRDSSLLSDEEAARNGKLGLWGLPSDLWIPPWSWRQGRRDVGNNLIGKLASNANVQFTCGTKRTCGQMSSCAEAQFHLKQCGLTRLDGNDDGLACGSLCR